MFKWMKGRHGQDGKSRGRLSPILEPMALLDGYARLAAEYWAEIDAGRKVHPLEALAPQASIVDLWSAALIETMGYLVKYSAPDPSVHADIAKQVDTIREILRQYASGSHERKELQNAASGIWPSYDFMRRTARLAGETTFGAMDGNVVFVGLLSRLTAELPKWEAGPPSTMAMPKTVIEIVSEDVAAKTKLLALSLKLGPSYLTNWRHFLERIADEEERRKTNEVMQLILVSTSPDDYWARRSLSYES